jgi:hypothetical protein
MRRTQWAVTPATGSKRFDTTSTFPDNTHGNQDRYICVAQNVAAIIARDADIAEAAVPSLGPYVPNAAQLTKRTKTSVVIVVPD